MRRKTDSVNVGEQLMDMLAAPTSSEEWASFDEAFDLFLGAFSQEEKLLEALQAFVVDHGIKGDSQFPNEAIVYRGSWKFHNVPEVVQGKVTYKLQMRNLAQQGCPSCESKVESGQKYCAQCGVSLERNLLKPLAA